MKSRHIFTFALVLVSITSAFAQNSNSSQTMRPRTTNTPTPARTPAQSTDVQKPAATKPAARATEVKPKITGAQTPGSQTVVAAFNTLVNGIRNADAKAVNSVYLDSPRLTLFNYNGTVTKSWSQMRMNRESYYHDLKDVKLDVRDVSITMLGREGALVSCLWTQSQTFRGKDESFAGRMTLVFKRIGKNWKAIHLHTSTSNPDPSRIPASEQAPPPS